MVRTKVKDALAATEFGHTVLVKGWIRTRRGSKKLSFIELSDGSTARNLQLVLEHSRVTDDLLAQLTTGAAIGAEGTLVQSQGKEQSIELQVERLEVFGPADPETYPLQKKAHSLEFLREIGHLRPRTATFGAVLRLRHSLAFAIHEFFHQRGFFHLHTPIITASDAEGAGEMFQVTTLPLDRLPLAAGAVDYSHDFFGKPAHLTVSGQLEGELAALGIGEIYTFGPTFRAENSNTTRHLAEFWMIEPEMAFYDLRDTIALAQDLLHHAIRFALQHNPDDLALLEDKYEPGLRAKLENVVASEVVVVDYTDAIDVLQTSGRSFDFPVTWGMDLQTEHERYLAETHFQRPVAVINYPKAIKAFYMRQNEDGKTVAAMDILFPGIGEVVGGSQREERLDRLEGRIHELGLPMENYSWYLDTRRFGSAPHSGFGMGFERLLLFCTGMSNIRDVIPFPRTPGSCEF